MEKSKQKCKAKNRFYTPKMKGLIKNSSQTLLWTALVVAYKSDAVEWNEKEKEKTENVKTKGELKIFLHKFYNGNESGSDTLFECSGNFNFYDSFLIEFWYTNEFWKKFFFLAHFFHCVFSLLQLHCITR